jgi:hypothetical protein
MAQQNEILEKYGVKKVNKSERLVEFNLARKTTAREFLWHLVRIHHWWNCRGKNNTNKPLEVKLG